MVFGRKSSDAPALSESSQNRVTKTTIEGVKVEGYNRLHQLRYLYPKNKCSVYHIWKSNAPGKLINTHHSHIRIELHGFYCHLGLFAVDRGDAMVIVSDNIEHINPVKYKTSTSYKPNPLLVNGEEIYSAFRETLKSIAEEYGLLLNNCQKFGRIFMTNLGSEHNRKYFHM